MRSRQPDAGDAKSGKQNPHDNTKCERTATAHEGAYDHQHAHQAEQTAEHPLRADIGAFHGPDATPRPGWARASRSR